MQVFPPYTACCNGPTQGYRPNILQKKARQKSVELWGRVTGIEPAASGTTTRCSTTELHPPYMTIDDQWIANLMSIIVHCKENFEF